MIDLKSELDELVDKYETLDFIKNDPVGFLHNYSSKQDIEIAGLVASSLAYGKREAFIEKLKFIFSVLGKNPYLFCINLDKNYLRQIFENFKYRFNTGDDICMLLESLFCFYNEFDSFDDFLLDKLVGKEEKAKLAVNMISTQICGNSQSKSFKYMFPNPQTGSACKRLNLFLKWMVRKPPVDRGIWNSLEPKDLIIPLDVHVAKVSRKLGLTTRKTNDWQTAEEITAKLRCFSPDDPIRYDFALFDIGVEKIPVSL